MTAPVSHSHHRRCLGTDLGVGDGTNGSGWPAGEILLARTKGAGNGSAPGDTGGRFVLAIPSAALDGERLTAFLDRVAPFGCPVPGSLIRAYSLPDAPFPSILLKEHEAAPDGIAESYDRFVAEARRRWIAALGETGPGLSPALAWQSGPVRRFLAPDEAAEVLTTTGAALAGAADHYVGRGLLLLADPHLADAWPTMMSLGGVTKIRKITGREFPVWVDLPGHQPALLGSPLLARAEQLLDGA
jgi:hypothetical protein